MPAPLESLPPPDGTAANAVTVALQQAVEDGLPHEALVQRLLPVVYDELRMIARAQRRRYASSAFQTTALVHEAYLRLAGHPLVPDRAYVFAAAAQAMRRVLADHARRRYAAKRGGGELALGSDALDAVATSGEDLDALASRVLDVDAALGRLAALDERATRVVECRYFGGLSVEATAAALGVSEVTVKRDWRRARAWLHRALADGHGDGADDPVRGPVAKGGADLLPRDAA